MDCPGSVNEKLSYIKRKKIINHVTNKIYGKRYEFSKKNKEIFIHSIKFTINIKNNLFEASQSSFIN